MAREKFSGDLIRFLAAGAVNTGLTACIYFLCALFVSPAIAYAISWGFGLLFVAIVYPNKVFVGGKSSPAHRLGLALTTVAVFLTGLAILRILTAQLGDHRIAFLITLAVTTMLNFVLGRYILRRL